LLASLPERQNASEADARPAESAEGVPRPAPTCATR